MVFFLVMSVLMFRPFCRFICPLGAIYSFFNKLNLVGIGVDEKKCTKCGICVKQCNMDVKEVGDHECIQCGKCIPSCPVKAIHFKGSLAYIFPGYHKENLEDSKTLSTMEGEKHE
jgi:polyferredoxin